MKLKVTQKGVYDNEGQRVPIGTVITIKGKEIPANLVNKVEVVGKPAEDTTTEAVTNPAKDPLPKGKE